MKKSERAGVFSSKEELSKYVRERAKMTQVRSAIGLLCSKRGRLSFEKKELPTTSPLTVEDVLEVLRADLARRKAE